MGQHKYNQTAIDAKEGRIEKKKKDGLSKRQLDALLRNEFYRRTGADKMLAAMNGEEIYF